MNAPLMIVGAVVTSMIILSYLINKRNSPSSGDDPSTRGDDTLDEDLKDILGFIPLESLQLILNDYVMFDKQVAETKLFIDEQKKFIIGELMKIREVSMLLQLMRDLGLDVDEWHSQVRNCWTSLPSFQKSDPSVAAGGLTGMISRMLELIPTEELHMFLRDKTKYSTSFQVFLLALRSPVFLAFCQSVQQSVVLGRHFYWAKQDQLEAVFAMELLKKLHVYLTEGLS